MNLEANQHYVNKNGKQLNDFLKHKFSYEQIKAWYIMQVMKYLAREGLKAGESEEKDHNKALDYSQELATLINENKKENIDGVLTKYGVLKICQNLVDEFKEW